MRISVCLIVKNEETQLARALASIPKDCETIVVDTGSTDRTLEIAAQWGANIHHYEWNDHFADARNASIQYATGDYIFIMDADEQLPADWELALKRHLKQFPNRPATVIIHNITEGELTAHKAVRLFPNRAQYKFHGKVHEQLYDGKKLVSPVESSIYINHYGYAQEQFITKSKFERYIRLYNEELELNPHDGYMLYQLGKLYYSLKQYKEAYEPLAASAELQQFDQYYYPPLIVMLGYTLKELNRSMQAYELLEPLASMFSKFPDLPFLLGILSMEIGHLDKMELHFKQALSIGETTRYTTVVGCGSYRAAHNLGVFYEVTNQPELAKQFYGLAAEQHFEPSIHRLQELSVKS